MFTAGIAGNETSSDNENSLELDPFVGLAGAIGNTGFGYDVGYVQFTFPGAPGDFDFAELYLNLSYSIEDLTATTRAYWSDDYFGKDFLGEENSLAIEQELRYKTPWKLTATATVGEQMIDIPGEQRAIFGADNGDYLYWGVGLETELKDLTWHIRYWDTDTDDALVAACFKAEECDGRVTFGVTKNF